MKRLFAAAVLAGAFATTAFAQTTTKPITFRWIAFSCAEWSCAATELAVANGDKYVIVLPTGNESRPWLVLKRVEEGAIVLPENEPFSCQTFPTLVDATVNFTTIDKCHGALALTLPDGQSLVASLAKCPETAPARRRAVR